MKYLGKYRGVVEAIDDPEQRLRCRVRVTGVHYQETPVEHLSWAELVVPFSAPGAGDFYHFERGDRVWVEFESGNIDYPLIVGGWVAKQRGLSDLPADKISDYARGLRRWTRQDRAGNLIEMSENGDELWVRMQSGRATIKLSQIDDGIEIESPSTVRVNAGKVIAKASQIHAESGDVVISANRRDPTATGKITLLSNHTIDLVVQDLAHGGAANGAINVGQRLADGALTEPNGTPHQSPRVNLYADEVHVGARDNPPYLPTTNVYVKAANAVRIDGAVAVEVTSATAVAVSAPQVSVDATTAAVTASGTINLDAPQINVGL